MIRVFVLYNRPEDPAAFDRYYRETHIGLAQKLPGLRRFTIARPQAPRGDSPYYLIAELDFDDQAALQAAMGSPEGKTTVDDLGNFATSGVTVLVGEVEDVTG